MAMIQVVLGKRGSGKSKRLIDLANEALKTEHGLVVFVDDDKNNMYDLRHEVRLVDASEFALGEYRSASWFYGLMGGMLAINFDISLVFVDAFMKLVNCTDPNLLEPLFNQMESLSKEHNVNFVLGVSGDPDTLPEFITRYAV
jgi:energy-coupling factor transporter ATP-binding protein EcfA2